PREWVPPYAAMVPRVEARPETSPRVVFRSRPAPSPGSLGGSRIGLRGFRLSPRGPSRGAARHALLPAPARDLGGLILGDRIRPHAQIFGPYAAVGREPGIAILPAREIEQVLGTRQEPAPADVVRLRRRRELGFEPSQQQAHHPARDR